MKIRDRIRELRRVKASELSRNARNWRKHPSNQADALRGVLSEIGWADAVLAYERDDGSLELIDGHLRAETAGDEMVPVLVLDVDATEAAKILATHDPLAAMAEADPAALAALLEEIDTESAALQQMLDELAEDVPADDVEVVEDETPEPPADPITKPGDLWLLGEHRLLCGDSTRPEDVARLMDRKRAELCHADPPYGMGKESEGVANDNLYASKLDAFQMEWWRAFRPHLVENASAYVWGNAADLWRWWYVGGLRDSEPMVLRNEIVWDKGFAQQFDKMENGNPTLRSYNVTTERCLFVMLGEQGFNNNADNYWEGWEPIRSYLDGEMKRCGWTPRDLNRITGTQMGGHWVTRSQWALITAEHYEAIQKAAQEHDAFKQQHDELKQQHDELKQQHDELKRAFYETRSYFDNTHDNMTDVWSFDRVKGEDRHGHATPKPVQMIARAIMSSSRLGAVVVEPFLGSGTTLIAAEQLGRKCYGMEISPAYCDVIVKRWETLTGKRAERVQS